MAHRKYTNQSPGMSRKPVRKGAPLDLGPPMREWGEVAQRNLASSRRAYSDYISSLPYANTPGYVGKAAHGRLVQGNKKARALRAEIEYWEDQAAGAPARSGLYDK